MGDMDERTGADGGPDEHLADAGGPVAGTGSAGSTGPDDDGPLIDADQEPRLAAFLERSSEVLRVGPDEFTARRHLTAMQREAAVGRGHTGLRVASIAAAAAVAAVVTLAGFGALPAPAQQVMAEMAERIGVTIPNPAADTSPASPADESPGEQQPDPETVPGFEYGPDRSELPGLDDDGELRTPWHNDGFTPYGLDEEWSPPGKDDGFVVPGDPDVRGPPEGTEEGEERSPEGSGEPPPPPPEELQDPADERGSDASEDPPGTPEEPPAPPIQVPDARGADEPRR